MLISIHTLFFGSVHSGVTRLTSGATASRHLEWGRAASGLYIRRGCCSQVFLWDDLPQPGGVVACPKRRHASLVRGPPHGRCRRRHLEGETAASGLHGVGLAVGLARMLLPGVALGRPETTGWRGPLVKARPWEVKGLDLVVNRSRVRRDGGPGGGG